MALDFFSSAFSKSSSIYSYECHIRYMQNAKHNSTIAFQENGWIVEFESRDRACSVFSLAVTRLA